MRPFVKATLICAVLFGAAALHAYSVKPMIYSLSPTGSGSTTRLTVTNPRDGVLNVELEPYRVVADRLGKRTFQPAPDDFILFPPQSSILADHTQVFQVRYVGPAQLDAGRTYVLRVHQTNTIELAKPTGPANTETHLGLALNFNTTAIVQPPNYLPELVVVTDLARGADGLLHATIRNGGRGVADLSRIQWSIRDGTQARPLPLDQINYGDAVFLDPGAERELSLAKQQTGTGNLEMRLPGAGRGAQAR